MMLFACEHICYRRLPAVDIVGPEGMQHRRYNLAVVTRRGATFAVALLAIAACACMPPAWGANALLHPQRRPMTRQPTRPLDAVEFDGAGVRLKGWWFHAPAKRATVVFLHGVADNRGSSVGIA